MTSEEKPKYIKMLSKKPILPTAAPKESKTRQIAEEFMQSNGKYAEVSIMGEFKSPVSLSRAIGRALHAGKNALDPDGKVRVVADKKNHKVYLMKE